MCLQKRNEWSLFSGSEWPGNPIYANVAEGEFSEFRPAALDKCVDVGRDRRSALYRKLFEVGTTMNKHVPELSGNRLILCSAWIKRTNEMTKTARTIHKEINMTFVETRSKVQGEARKVTKVEQLAQS